MSSIGSSAFWECVNLTSLNIPKNVNSIGDSAFSGCCSLTSIQVENGNLKYDSRNNCNAIIEKHANFLIAGCKNTQIPNGVTSIGAYAFMDFYDLPSLRIPETVTYIGMCAFQNWMKLANVYCYSRDVPYTSPMAFKDSGIDFITLHVPSDSINKYKVEEPWKNFKRIVALPFENKINDLWYILDPDEKVAKLIHYKDTAYSGILVIPPSVDYKGITYKVTSIDEHAFCECENLTSITIPESIVSIGSQAFYNCYRLSSIYSLNPTPPSCAGNTFICAEPYVRDAYDIYNYATLHIPSGSEDAYSSAYEWRYFNKKSIFIEFGD